MDPVRREPIQLFDAVVDGMDAPQDRNGVERTVSQIKTEIGQQYYLCELKPNGLRSYGGAQFRRYEMSGRETDGENRKRQTEFDQQAGSENVAYIRQPAAPKNFLVWPQRQQLLERHENQADEQQSLDVNPVQMALPVARTKDQRNLDTSSADAT
jgi:hypothetical protein